jgi:predicted nucleic acid-binding protein
VVDSNVWIHLHHAGLIEETARLPFELTSPDVVVAELEDPEGQLVLPSDLIVATLDAHDIVALRGLAACHTRTSIADLAALVIAERDRCALVTGDAALRKVAEEHGLRVHGVLWVLDHLVQSGLVKPSRAAAGLRAMLDMGARIPRAECSQRLIAWDQ